MKKKIGIATLTLFSLLSFGVNAQDQGVGEMMFTAGTVMTDSSSNEWAWIQWMATDSELLKDRPMDVYLKEGNAASANLFSFQGRVQQVTDPRIIELLLSRGETLGEDLTSLEAAIDSLYAGAEPAGSLSLAEKLSALISGSQDDPDLYQNLVFMGRAHPAISMAIGHGFAGKIPTLGTSTFEVRDHSNDEVIGRVTLVAGSPEILPAPGPISRVPELSPKGNLNIRLRWDVPDDLKRVSLMQFGYNLYRVTKYAADKWWGATPPTTAQLLDVVDRYESAKKVNRMPILVDAATATPDTWFAVDDNDGQSEGGTPFVDGADYYYFVTALDLLGRDGDLSDAFLTFPCDRMAPSVPHGVETRTISDFVDGVRTQWVEVSWSHNTNDTDTARYYVYRHTGMADMQSNAVSAVANRISGAIVPSPGDTRLSYEDRSLSSNDWSITYWYTVRAEDNARCTNNLSGNSGPAYGLARDRIGPGATTGAVLNIQIESLSCEYDHLFPHALPGGSHIQLACTRPSTNHSIQWAEFSYYVGGYRGEGSETTATSLGRIFFSSDRTRVLVGLEVANKEQSTFFCRVGSSGRKRSPYANKTLTVDQNGIEFNGDSMFLYVPTEGGPDGPGPHHWGNGPRIDPVRGVFPYDEEGQGSIRIYRRVDGGRRTLIDQVLVTNEVDEIVFEDQSAGSANGGRICYYFQKFDEHGNGGPMELWGCIEVEPRVDLPTPILDSIDSTGESTNAPGMALTWFCTTPGVERFEVAIGLEDGDLLPTFGTQGYELQENRTNEMDFVVGGVTNRLNVGFYRTGRIGTTFGTAGSPLFEIENTAELNRDYQFMVRVIGTVGTAGEWSNAEEFHWYTVPTEGPNVPWPSRDDYSVQSATFHTNLTAHLMDEVSYEGYLYASMVGIRIGELPASFNVEVRTQKPAKVEIYEQFKPMDYLYPNEAHPSQTMMPCVLYRYQLTNSVYRTVSGDVAQVSPLMEKIAYGYNDSKTVIYDPFIAVSRPAGSAEDWGLFLMDTQPVVRGAKYQYLLMRFDEATHELDKIIPAGTVTIPLN